MTAYSYRVGRLELPLATVNVEKGTGEGVVGTYALPK